MYFIFICLFNLLICFRYYIYISFIVDFTVYLKTNTVVYVYIFICFVLIYIKLLYFCIVYTFFSNISFSKKTYKTKFSFNNYFLFMNIKNISGPVF